MGKCMDLCFVNWLTLWGGGGRCPLTMSTFLASSVTFHEGVISLSTVFEKISILDVHCSVLWLVLVLQLVAYVCGIILAVALVVLVEALKVWLVWFVYKAGKYRKTNKSDQISQMTMKNSQTIKKFEHSKWYFKDAGDDILCPLLLCQKFVCEGPLQDYIYLLTHYTLELKKKRPRRGTDPR